MLGLCYSEGKGVQENKKEAVELYRKAVQQRDETGQYLLTACYDNEDGVLKDKEAVKWLQKSAERGEWMHSLYLRWYIRMVMVYQ